MAKYKFKTSQATETTLGEVYEEYIMEKQARSISPATLRNYKQSYNLFCEYHEIDADDYPLSQLNMKMFYKWIQHMKENEVRPQSINHYLRDWRTFMNWCELREMMEEPLKIKEIEVQEGLPKMYTDEEMVIMLEKPRAGDSFSEWRTWAIISTVFATGLRASTICHLTIGDIDFKREEITIQKQKNKRAGTLPLTPALANALREYIKKYLKGEDKDYWLFPSSTGVQLTTSALNQGVERYCINRGVKPHGIHSVRHNFARDMILNGGGEIRLQNYLQHSSIQMSQHYVKLFGADLKKDAEEFSPLDNLKRGAKRTSAFKKHK